MLEVILEVVAAILGLGVMAIIGYTAWWIVNNNTK